MAVWPWLQGTNLSWVLLKWRIHPQLGFKLQLLPLLVTDTDPGEERRESVCGGVKGKTAPLPFLSCQPPRSREAPGLGPVVAWEGNQIQRATHGLSPTPSHLQGHQTQHRKVQKPFPGTEMVSLSPSGFPESPLLFLPSPFPESVFVSVDSQLRLLPVLGRTASHFACYSFLASATSRENESHSPGSVGRHISSAVIQCLSVLMGQDGENSPPQFHTGVA